MQSAPSRTPCASRDHLDYMPNSDSILKIKKEEYETKLFKAEMRKESAPWTVAKLIDEIACNDLACASPVKEASEAFGSNERPLLVLGPNTKCGGCGAIGKHLSRDCPEKCSTWGVNFRQQKKLKRSALVILAPRDGLTRRASLVMVARTTFDTYRLR